LHLKPCSLPQSHPCARGEYTSCGKKALVDHISVRGDTIVFVEVKARGLMDDALSAITARKRQRFSRAVRTWLTRNDWARSRTWRADAVFIAPRRWPQHIVSAFELEMP
jgi:putative endonuclease